VTNARYFGGLPGAPPRVSQRRTHPPRVLAAPLFCVGDVVTWNQRRYRGIVQELLGDEALVKETSSPMGGDRYWRLELATLSRQ
jgi:hypothetical protein